MPLKFFFLSFVSIVIISFIVLYPSFNLAFQDEDWRGVVLPKTDYAGSRLSSYSSPVWFMDTLYSFIGPNFRPYYILSFSFRILLAFSVLVLVHTITKDRLAAFLGGLFMAVTATGIQNTYEVMNMIAYISMTGLVLFLIAFLKSLNKFSFLHLVPMGIFLIFSTFLTSFRVYPLYLWAFIVDGSQVLLHFKKDLIKAFLIRQVLIFVIFFFLYKIGIFIWYGLASTENKVNEFTKFASDFISLIMSLDLNVAAKYFTGLGNIIFPSMLDKSGTISLILGIALAVIFVGTLVYAMKNKLKNFHLLLSFIFWPLLFFTLYFIIYVGRGHRESPPLPSDMRYLMPPFIGLNIALAILISLTKKFKYSSIILGSLVILILMHTISTYSFLNKLSKQRDGAFMSKIWKQIPQIVPQSSLSIEKMNVFYFETDTPRALYTVNDGFIPHLVAVYKIDTKPSKFDSEEISAFSSKIAPPIISYGELVAYIQKSLSEKPEPDIWNRIFALKVEGEAVIDIKENVRKRLNEIP